MSYKSIKARQKEGSLRYGGEAKNAKMSDMLERAMYLVTVVKTRDELKSKLKAEFTDAAQSQIESIVRDTEGYIGVR